MVAGLDPRQGSGRAAVQRLEREPVPALLAARLDGDHGLAVGGDGALEATAALGGHRAQRPGLEIVHVQADRLLRLRGREHDAACVGQPPGPAVVLDLRVADRLHVAGPGGEDRHPRLALEGERDHGAAVGGERDRPPFAQAHRRRAVGRPDVDRVLQPAALAALVEEERACRPRTGRPAPEKSNQERSTSDPSARRPRISMRWLLRSRSSVPSGETSCRTRRPGAFSTRRRLPDRSTAYSAESAPTSAAVNSTSSPSGSRPAPRCSPSPRTAWSCGRRGPPPPPRRGRREATGARGTRPGRPSARCAGG